MEYYFLQTIVSELAGLLIGASIERVLEAEDGNIHLILRRAGKTFVLLLSADRSLPRMHLVSKKPKAAEIPQGFALYARSRLTRSSVSNIMLLGEDRVVAFRLSRAGTESWLIYELIGSSLNIIVTDANRQILALMYPVSPEGKGARSLLPGGHYAQPSKKTHIRVAAGPDSGVPQIGEADSPNRIAEAWYAARLSARHIRVQRSELLSAISKSLVRIQRRIAAINADFSSAQMADSYRTAGELILAQQARCPRGSEAAILTDDAGKPINVRLDPKRSATDNAAVYFKKYKKAKAGRAIIAERLQTAERERETLHSLHAHVAEVHDEQTIEALRSQAYKTGILQPGNRKKAKSESSAAPYRKVTLQGWDVLVGKSAAGNDYITMTMSKPDDLWLHAEGMPGSHVLVRNPERRDIPREVLLRAASLAAYYSKGKGAGKVSVAYTFAKHVRKPKGAKAGTVLLSERKTVMVAPSDA